MLSTSKAISPNPNSSSGISAFVVHHLSHEHLNEKQYTKALLVKPGEQVPAVSLNEGGATGGGACSRASAKGLLLLT